MSANQRKTVETFDAVGLKNVLKSTRNKVLHGMEKNISPIKKPPMNASTAKREYNGIKAHETTNEEHFVY